MTNNKSRESGVIAEIYDQLGANERAMIDRQQIAILRRFYIVLVGLKLRLQFTGWLQYMLPVPIMLALFFSAGIAYLFGIARVGTLIALAGLLVLALFVFDLSTVKFRIRPREPLPKRNDGLGIFDLMRARRSCRSFQTRKLTSDDHHELMSSMRRHSDEKTIGKAPIRFEYIAAPLTVWPTVNASEFIVAIAPHEYDRLAVIDIGRSLQKIVMDATRMGLGTCWIGPGADQTSVMQHLGDRFSEEEDHIVCVCAIGYRSRFVPVFIRIFNAQFHQRLPLSSLFFADSQLKVPLDVHADPFSRFGRIWEVCQWSPSSYNGQTTRCVAVTEEAVDCQQNSRRLLRLDFYSVTASRYYAAVAVGIWCANWEMGCETLGAHGHFEVLSNEARGVREDEKHPIPRYDVSWVVGEAV